MRDFKYDSMSDDLQPYLDQIRACRLCVSDMSRAPHPVLQASAGARILVAGQAPGNLADVTGIPFNDPSGTRLRDWMGVTDEEFYDRSRVAIVPMGFAFPDMIQEGQTGRQWCGAQRLGARACWIDYRQ